LVTGEIFCFSRDWKEAEEEDGEAEGVKVKAGLDFFDEIFGQVTDRLRTVTLPTSSPEAEVFSIPFLTGVKKSLRFFWCSPGTLFEARGLEWGAGGVSVMEGEAFDFGGVGVLMGPGGGGARAEGEVP
jgi:hypothetical protein